MKKLTADFEPANKITSKAGLASSESLDDSYKDQANNDEVDKSKLNIEGLERNEKKSFPENIVKTITCINRRSSYQCSIDDGLIVLGAFLFVLLLTIICYVIMYEGAKVAPVREGIYVDAVTTCGMVEGIREEGAYAFRGIPYALPPIGDKRWTPAEFIENVDHCWNGTLKAHNGSDLCSQILINGTKIGSENCLTLDIITPQVRYHNPVPVIVLIGAESLVGGSPGILRPSARQARIKDVVFVRPNFRLGPFGFLALEVISKAVNPPTSGNYGLSDIIAALKWIKLNIAHFGGDEKSVVLLGHRAGATLVSAIVTSSEIKNFYSKAWISSGSSIFPSRSLVESEKRNQQFMESIKCSDIKCLKSASTNAILDAIPDAWMPHTVDLPDSIDNFSAHEWLVLDGNILHENPINSWKTTNITTNHKLIIGTTAHESHSEKLFFKYDTWTPQLVKTHIQQSQIGKLNLTEEVILRYNLTYQGLIAMISDIRTICPLLAIAKLHQSIPFYVVTHPEPKNNLADVNADVQSILGRYEPHTSQQRRFMTSMQNYFYYYVAHGKFQNFDEKKTIIIMDQDPLPAEDYLHCKFWTEKNIVPQYARRE